MGPSPAPQPCRAHVPQPCLSPCPPFVPAASAGLLENCTGCVLCSEDNGCITCHHRLFLLIWRDGIRQYGMCVHTCPPGYFGVRGLEVNRCTKCRSPSCESCFSRDFCMKCKDKFYLHKGQCFRQCPPSTTAQPGTRECQETCEPGPWSEWSACTHEGRTCGCKWGLETRVREVAGAAKEEGAVCPALLETRRCRMRKHCPGGEHRTACRPSHPSKASPEVHCGRGAVATVWRWPASLAVISQAF
ncbi:R-spondin-4 isoform X1 [Larus michahellis]|uniref:R-spondin-4 isoform X1 n=1 Tax=Larus michahellis TaxID=119627 RepID=UPI003D9AFD05